jgi:hypothetical protein
MAFGKYQFRIVAVLRDNHPLLSHGQCQKFAIRSSWIEHSSAGHVVTGIAQRLRYSGADMNVEQKPQATLALPIAA